MTNVHSIEVGDDVLAQCGTSKNLAKVIEISPRGNALIHFESDINNSVCGDKFFSLDNPQKISQYTSVDSYDVVEYKRAGLSKLFTMQKTVIETINIDDRVSVLCGYDYSLGYVADLTESGLVNIKFDQVGANLACSDLYYDISSMLHQNRLRLF
jgi:hypothetical protein